MAARSKPHARWGFRVLGLVLLALLGWASWEYWSWPDVARLARERPATTAFIEDYRGRQRAAGKPDKVAWTWTPYAAISPHLKRAVLVAEDISFFSHHGFELKEMQNAMEEALREGNLPRGASTITQQLAKNLWLSSSRNPLRKIREAALTWQLERALPKRRILELYLNVAEFGPGIYGAGAASQRYFGKPAADLEPREAAALAAGLPKPRAWHPGSTSVAYQRRVTSILSRMDKAAFLARQI
ncbi:MAG TPA: monofunctional biosynthetic peptidoglycan transglycosylase [Candidatus Nitrosocosmicus sp.]|jgi:monofunctional biosynthetic peptidoglycan transglycosylase|nr:monofunctional biosynthetic peptidoglycan transglycosylase [Candidatus Nitrosocosmicus sp.]